MRDNMKAPNHQPTPSQQNFRSTFSHQQAASFMRSQGSKFHVPDYNANNQGNHPSTQNTEIRNFNANIKNLQSKIQGIESHTRKANNEGGQMQNRRNSTDFPQLKTNNPSNPNSNQTHFQSKMEEAQREADLRGSCPNIMRKIQQSGLRNTTHWAGPPKFPLPFQASTQASNTGSKPQLLQLPVNSFMKHQSPKNNTFYGSPITHSIVVQDDEDRPKVQITNKNGKATSRSTIEVINKYSNKSFLATKFANNSLDLNIENMPSPPENKPKSQFKSLNDILGPKGHKKSEEYNTEELNKFVQADKPKSSKMIREFEIGQVLGKGKFGQVFLARHKETGFVVALKKIVKSKVKEYKMIDQLKDEIKIHSAMNHPNIIRFYGCFQDGQDLYLVIEYMNGGTLFDYLADRQKLTIRQTVDFLKDTISALEHMHEKSIAHRDIKPENIVLSTEGVAKLCDFGWAAVVQGSRKTYCGTFDYAPPEILQRKDYDSSVDIWCIGVLTYELLTGKVPFEGQIRNQIMEKIINVDKNRVQYPTDMPEYAKQFIQALMRKDPSERPKCKDLLKFDIFTQNPPIQAKKSK